jgi:hypothetical protein
MPKQTVVAGAWQIETNTRPLGNLESLDVTGVFPVGTKIATMTQVVDDFYRDAQLEFQRQSQQGQASPLYIFVAPEYYFKRTLTQRCLTKVERDQVRTAMTNLAQSHPHLLLIPGTVTWKKPLDKKAYAKAAERLEARLAMEASYIGKKELPKPSWPRGKAKSDGAYNTAYLYTGNQIMKYHKMEDVGELKEDDLGVIFIPGDGNNVFTVSGLTIGVEICGDHEANHLKHEVDIHIVTSASVSRKNDHVMAKNGGLFICADSTHDSEILSVDRDADEPMSAAQSTVTQPDFGMGAAKSAFFKRRWDTTEEINKGYWAKHPEYDVQERKKLEKAKVRLAYGGKLTTAVVQVDTV